MHEKAIQDELLSTAVVDDPPRSGFVVGEIMSTKIAVPLRANALYSS